MKIIGLIALSMLGLAAERTYAQQAPAAPNALYVELGGNAGIWSLNYERNLGNGFALRAGGGYVSVTGDGFDTSKVTLLMIPLTASYLSGAGPHYFEVGGGVIFIQASASSDTTFASGSGVAATGIAGYRYGNPLGGFLFRAGFTPLIGSGGFLPWFGASLGFSY